MIGQRWKPEWNALLGKEHDGAVARKVGVHRSTVVYWRRKLGIPPCVRRVDHSGARFGRWTLVRRLANGRNGAQHYEARCDCGYVAEVQLSNLTGGLSTGCRHCGYSKHALKAGARRGDNEIVDVVRAGKRRRFYVRCNGCGRVRKLAAAPVGEHCAVCGQRRVVDAHGERITFGGETHNFAAWAKKLGISRQALHLRIANGWPLERALTTPRSAA